MKTIALISAVTLGSMAAFSAETTENTTQANEAAPTVAACEVTEEGIQCGENCWANVETITLLAANGDPIAQYAIAWITENGTCDNEDRFRCRYLYDHLKAISKSTLPFERYYHWCFCDNFEWVEGNYAKFGLVQINPQTRERQIKASGLFYSSIIREKGVSKELYRQFVANQEYNVK